MFCYKKGLLFKLIHRPQWTKELNKYRIEAALKLGSWDKLDNALSHEHPSNRNWPVLVGRTMKAAKERVRRFCFNI